jgi:hypothetical protein
MRMGWLMTLVLVIAATMPPITVRQARAQEAQGEQTGDCPHERGWKPKDLSQILEEHREWVARWRDKRFSQQWLEEHPEGKANLCDADLRGAELNGADLTKAKFCQTTMPDGTLNNRDCPPEPGSPPPSEMPPAPN